MVVLFKGEVQTPLAIGQFVKKTKWEAKVWRMGLAGQIQFLKAKSSNLFRYLYEESNINFMINFVALIIHSEVTEDMAKNVRTCS